METIFAATAVAIMAMIGLRILEIKFQRQIILSHVTLPIDRVAHRLWKKAAAKASAVKERAEGIVLRLKARIKEGQAETRESAREYYEFLADSMRGKKMLSRGSVSFFLLNISDYNLNWKKKNEEMPMSGMGAMEPVKIHVTDGEARA